MDLFATVKKAHEPLAARMRPQKLTEVLGQPHLTGEKALLPKLIHKDQFGSLIFIGPPGCGKTSLAEAIAAETKSRFVRLNATTDGTKEVRTAIEEAKLRPEQITTLFVDELHRFNKAQQDQLLPAVEDGTVRLIGATTHNPAFYVIPPLLSRSHLFRLNAITPPDIVAVLKRALVEDAGLGNLKVSADKQVLETIARFANGDVRQALNALEALASIKDPGEKISLSDLTAFAAERNFKYDRDEDQWADTTSALIKSCRGCDPDAAMYWLQRLLAGGEDPRYVARRLVILASEDVGLADPQALQIATAAAQAVETVGLPEAKYALAHATIYLALAPKSNSITQALSASGAFVQENPDLEVPKEIRDGHYRKPRYQGEPPEPAYLYSHDYELNVSGQNYLPVHAKFLVLKDTGDEKRLKDLAIQRRILKTQKSASAP